MVLLESHLRYLLQPLVIIVAALRMHRIFASVDVAGVMMPAKHDL
jgi:hypothetical protein